MHFSDSFFVYGLLLIYEETGRGSSAEMSRMDKIANREKSEAGKPRK